LNHFVAFARSITYNNARIKLYFEHTADRVRETVFHESLLTLAIADLLSPSTDKLQTSSNVF